MAENLEQAGAELVAPLTDEEAERFAELEAVIVEVCGDLASAAGRFEKLGLPAIEEVRDRRLYRQRYPNFDNWCTAMLGKTRQAVDRAIRRARQIRELPPVEQPDAPEDNDGGIKTPDFDTASVVFHAEVSEPAETPTTPAEPEQMRLFIPAALKGEDVKRLVVVVGNQTADVLVHSVPAEALRRTADQCLAALRMLAPKPLLPPRHRAPTESYVKPKRVQVVDPKDCKHPTTRRIGKACTACGKDPV